MHRSHGVRLVAAAVIAMLVAGCGGPGSEPAGLGTETADGTLTTTNAHATPGEPTAGPSGTATAAPVDLPPGLVFENVPDVSGPEAAALTAYLGYETEVWRTFLAAEVSPDLATYAFPAEVTKWADSAEYQRDNSFGGGGRVVISPTIGRVSDQLVLIDACADMSELKNIVDGEEQTPEAIQESPIWVIEALVSVDEGSGGWKVSEYTQEPGRC